MTLTEPDLEARLRRDLAAVADTVTGAPAARARPRRHWWRYGLGIGVVAVPVLAGAAAYVRTGPEYVDTIPADTIVLRGDIDGDRYLVVESRRERCDRPVTGVEVVVESLNLLGSEWNTTGAEYADVGACEPDTAAWLADPARYSDGGQAVGDSFLWTWAVHPSVTAVRITTDADVEDLPVYAVDGAGYAVYEVPAGVATYTVDLMVGDQPVPGAREVQRVPARD